MYYYYCNIYFILDLDLFLTRIFKSSQMTRLCTVTDTRISLDY
jgi:hypothetical protein